VSHWVSWCPTFVFYPCRPLDFGLPTFFLSCPPWLYSLTVYVSNFFGRQDQFPLDVHFQVFFLSFTCLFCLFFVFLFFYLFIRFARSIPFLFKYSCIPLYCSYHASDFRASSFPSVHNGFESASPFEGLRVPLPRDFFFFFVFLFCSSFPCSLFSVILFFSLPC